MYRLLEKIRNRNPHKTLSKAEQIGNHVTVTARSHPTIQTQKAVWTPYGQDLSAADKTRREHPQIAKITGANQSTASG
jgi:hypothetical protein